MRNIQVRNLTSEDHLRRDCLVRERIRQGEFSTTVTRRCTYRVESKTVLPSLSDVIAWAMNVDPVSPRQVYVRKSFDPDSGTEKVDYKVLGYLYVVLESTVFCVGYRHVLSMDVAESCV